MIGGFAVYQIAFSPALNYPYGNPVTGFQTSPSWNQFLNSTSAYLSPFGASVTGGSGSVVVNGVSAAFAGLKFFGE